MVGKQAFFLSDISVPWARAGMEEIRHGVCNFLNFQLSSTGHGWFFGTGAKKRDFGITAFYNESSSNRKLAFFSVLCLGICV